MFLRFSILSALFLFSFPASTNDTFLTHASAKISYEDLETQKAVENLEKSEEKNSKLILGNEEKKYAYEHSHIEDKLNTEVQILNSQKIKNNQNLNKKSNKNLCQIEGFTYFTNEQKKIVESSLTHIPCVFLLSLENIKIFNDPDKPRAMASSRSLYIRQDLFSLPEAENVFIHEFGHIIDLGGLDGTSFAKESAFKDGTTPIFEDDPSVRFYSLSWKNTYNHQNDSKITDFCSEYGATDPFEDFSECFVTYIKNGNNFRVLAKKYPILQKKYDFIKDEVFGGKEFFTGKIQKNITVRVWDATKAL